MGFVGIVCLGCGACHFFNCYKPYDRTLIHYNAYDSDEEYDPDFDIKALNTINADRDP
jgi:hypothetical protein